MPDPKPRYLISGEALQKAIARTEKAEYAAANYAEADEIHDELQSLRSAPQAVSLEGVEEALRKKIKNSYQLAVELNSGNNRGATNVFIDIALTQLQNLAMPVMVGREELREAVQAGDEAYPNEDAMQPHGKQEYLECIVESVLALLAGKKA